jgi:hypothetical protein
LLRKPPVSKAAGSGAPQKIDVVSTSVALRGVRQLEPLGPELPSVREFSARPGVARTPLLPVPSHRTNQVPGISEGQSEAQLPARNAMFRVEGEYWHILYAGTRNFIRSSKGLFYLRHLLQHPGDKIHVSSLTALGDHYASAARRSGASADRGLAVPPKAPLLVNDVGTVIDARATWEYRRRLDELRSELEEASQWADVERAASIQREIELINKELASAYGLHGHLRRLDSQVERMRKAVTNRIHDGIDRIVEQNPVLGRHLSNGIRTGVFCRYSPENHISWAF